MTEMESLEMQIQQLWDEAQAMLQSGHIELRPATSLVKAMRVCADRAAVLGLVGGEVQLRKAADDLEALIRIGP